MLPIGKEDARNICLSLLNEMPKRMDSNSKYIVKVLLHNNSSVELNSYDDNPLFLSYHWLDNNGNVIIHDGIRSPLTNAIESSQKREIEVTIHTPHTDTKISDFILRLTLVQEYIQWFDEPDINSYLDIRIIIDDEKWWDESEEDSIVFGNVSYLNKAKLKKYFQYQNMCRPLYLGIETVNICNLKCIICPCSKMTRKRGLMDMDLFKKIVSDYCEIDGGDVSLTPVIGDIFLDKYLLERIKYLKTQSKIRDIGFITNAIAASRFNDKDLRFIINSTYRIDISIYGLNEEEYSTMTRTKGSYDKMIKGIKRIVNLNEKSVISFGFRFLINHSQTEIEQWIINNFNRNIPFGYILEYANWGDETTIKMPLPYDAKWMPVQEQKKKLPCYFPLASTKVFLNGDVNFCLCIDYNNDITENTIGNIKYERLIDIYNGVKARALWKNGFSKCKTCTFKNITLINFIEDYFLYLDKPLQVFNV